MKAMDFQISEEEFDLPFMREHGYQRRRCRGCGSYFWTVDPRTTLCGDAPCVDYGFIGRPPTRRKYTVSEMRMAFLEFFEKRGHRVVRPYPVVARWRDDLLVTIASIVDFQPYVTDGIAEPPANPLVVSQPCLRFEDIEYTGYTAGRHLTIFEMGGHHAFNFPNKPEVYWKNRTIELHHLFATEELGISGDLITYKEHFWSGGGNAGPDLEGSILGLEASTLVFMSYKLVGDGFMPSPVKTVDTGYGIERWTWLSQGVASAFEAVYQGVMEDLLRWAGVNIDEAVLRENAVYSAAYKPDEPSSSVSARAKAADRLGVTFIELMNVVRPYEELSAVLDHSKALIFLLTEGAVPSNVREGYLSRLLFRRLYRILMKYGVEDRLEDLVKRQIVLWGEDFEMLREMENEIFEMISLEEAKYLDTLEKGRGLVSRKARAGIDLEALIELYDSHGLHPEIVKEVAEGEEVEVEIPHDFFTRVAKRHENETKAEAKPVEEEIEEGYETEAIYYDDPYAREFDAKVLYSEGGQVVLDKTLFYAEGGGQKGDTGYLEFDRGRIRVLDTRMMGKNIVHLVEGEAPQAGSKVKGVLDWERRHALMRNHTATHVVLGASKRVLGKHIWQTGADKTPELARLDVTHYQRLTPEEVSEIERLANEVVSRDVEVKTSFMGRSEAEERHGTVIYQGGAVPGATLRIVEIEDWDVEACGGVQCRSTGELMLIKVLRTERIQDGVERLVYTTGMEAVKAVQEMEKVLWSLEDTMGAPRDDLLESASKMRKEFQGQRNRLKELQRAYVARIAEELIREAEVIGEVRAALYVSETDRDEDLIAIGEKFEAAAKDAVYVGCSLKGEKGASCIVFVGEKLREKGLKAIELARLMGREMTGGAAGDERFAKAGGRRRVDIRPIVQRYLEESSF